MKNSMNIPIFCLFVLFTATSCLVNKPIDIRNNYVKKGLTEEDYLKGKTLILEMEKAYGSKQVWESYQSATFIQRADWYGRKKISGWDTLPQRFEMKVIPGSENCELTLLNGPNKGTTRGLYDNNFYTLSGEKDSIFPENEKKSAKLRFKNYWFQFPFRIGEAPIIAFAGEETIKGKTYDLVFVTWESEKANSQYDQFILYLDQETHLVEYLYFTVREKLPILSLTARFKDFRQVEQFLLPHSQFISRGKPKKKGIKFHENHYEEIRLGNTGPG